MNIPAHLLVDNPDPEASERFLRVFEERHISQFTKLLRDDSLLSDVVTLSAFSPLLATTLLQTPDYVAWLRRRRKDTGVRGKEELLEIGIGHGARGPGGLHVAEVVALVAVGAGGAQEQLDGPDSRGGYGDHR